MRVDFLVVVAVCVPLLLALITPRVLNWSVKGEGGGNETAASSDDHPDTIAKATPVSLVVDETDEEKGVIENKDDADLFKIEPGDSTMLKVRLVRDVGSDLRPKLEILDSDGSLIDSIQVRSSSTRAETSFDVVSLDATYVRVSGRGGTKGSYNLTFIPSSDIGDSEDRAMQLEVVGRQPVQVESTIETENDVDYFRITIDEDGYLEIRQQKQTGSELDSVLSLFDDTNYFLESDDDSGLNGDAEIRWPVRKGDEFFVQAAAYQGTVGDYKLTFRIVDSDSDFPGLGSPDIDRVVRMGVDGYSLRTAYWSSSEGTHRYELTSEGSGLLTISAIAISPGFDPVLSVYDSRLTLLDENDDISDDDTNAEIQLTIEAGETYYVDLVGYENVSGEYDLEFYMADSASDRDLASAEFIELDSQGRGLHTENVLADDSARYYQIIPNLSGALTVTVNAKEGTNLDPILYVYNSQSVEIGMSDDEFGLDAQFSFPVRAGAEYFLKVDHYNDYDGGYTIKIETMENPFGSALDPGSTFADAGLIEADIDGELRCVSEIDVASDVDMFYFEARSNGTMAVEVSATASSSLDCNVAVYDEFERLLIEKDDLLFGFNTDSRVEFEVEEGMFYFIQVAASAKAELSESTGEYEITIESTE